MRIWAAIPSMYVTSRGDGFGDGMPCGDFCGGGTGYGSTLIGLSGRRYGGHGIIPDDGGGYGDGAFYGDCEGAGYAPRYFEFNRFLVCT